ASVTLALPLDLDRDDDGRELHRRFRLGDADGQPVDGGVVLEDCLGDRFRQRFDQLEALGAADLHGQFGDLAIMDRPGQVVRTPRLREVEFRRDVQPEALAEHAFFRQHAVEAVEAEIVDEDTVGHDGSRLERMASVTARASRWAATSCTRKAETPLAAARTLVASVPARRSFGLRPVISPMKRFRETPSRTGKPSATISSMRS